MSFAKGKFPIVLFLFGGLIILQGASNFPAQTTDNTWLRVSTDAESMIEVNRATLAIGNDRIITADFRTTLANEEPTAAKSSTTYKTRLDSIQFDTLNYKYRIAETTLSDASGKTVASYRQTDATGWKPIEGRTGRLLFNAASQLAPFGPWTVKSYRYASGETAQIDDPPELASLVGASFSLKLGYMKVFDKTCESPVFEPITLTGDEFLSKVGSPLKALGIQASKVDALILTCETVQTLTPPALPALTLNKKAQDVRRAPIEYSIRKRTDPKEFPEQTLILRLADGNALMLWNGVFLEIERGKSLFEPYAGN